MVTTWEKDIYIYTHTQLYVEERNLGIERINIWFGKNKKDKKLLSGFSKYLQQQNFHRIFEEKERPHISSKKFKFYGAFFL